MINSIGNLAGFVSPYMIGYLKDLTGRTDTALFVVAGGLVLGALLLAAVLRARPRGNIDAQQVRANVR
jgi:nitrate/nitrite transporter NarK